MLGHALPLRSPAQVGDIRHHNSYSLTFPSVVGLCEVANDNLSDPIHSFLVYHFPTIHFGVGGSHEANIVLISFVTSHNFVQMLPREVVQQ